MIEADKLGQLRTGAASGVAARHLAKRRTHDARRDRLRPAGRDPGRVHSRGRAGDRARGRLLPYAGAARGVLRAVGRRGGREPPRRRRTGRRRDGHQLDGPRAARRVATRRARSCAPRARTCVTPAGARQRRARARHVRLLRLARAGEARVGRPDRARRSAGVLDWLEVHELHEVVAGEVPAASRTRTSSSSSRTGSRPGTSRSAPRRSRARERGVGRRALGRVRSEAFAASTVSPEMVPRISGSVEQASLLLGVRRLCTYLSSRISLSERPRSCSRIT